MSILPPNGETPEEAKAFRASIDSWVDDWEDPAMDVYDDVLDKQSEPVTIPYPEEFRIRLHQNSNGVFCTLSGRPRNDAPYWHGRGATPGEAFQDAYNQSLQGFEGEGIRMLPRKGVA